MVGHEFVGEVESIIGPTLVELGYTLTDVDANVDEGGRSGAAVFYSGYDSRVQVYWSAREGEINCMVGPLDAPNTHGLYDKSKKWRYLREFAPKPDLPLEELVKVLREERQFFVSTTKWLYWLRGQIESHLSAARVGVLGLDD